MFEKTKQRHVKPCDILHAAKGIGSSVECEERIFHTYGKVDVQVGEVTSAQVDYDRALEALQARLQLIIDNLHVTDSVVAVLDTSEGVSELVTMKSDESNEWAELLLDLVQSSVDRPGTDEQIACTTVSIAAGDCSYLLALDCTSTLSDANRSSEHRYVASILIAKDGSGEDSIATQLSGTI